MKTAKQPFTLDMRRFRMALAALGLEQRELADRMGVSSSTLWRRLTGRIHWREGDIEKLEGALGVSRDWLTGGDQENAA